MADKPTVAEVARHLENNAYDDWRLGWSRVRSDGDILIFVFESEDQEDAIEDEDAWPSFSMKFKLIEGEDN